MCKVTTIRNNYPSNYPETKRYELIDQEMNVLYRRPVMGLTLPDMCCTGDQRWPLHCLICVVQATSDGPYIAWHVLCRRPAMALTLPDMCCAGDQRWPLHCLTCVVQATSDDPYIAWHVLYRRPVMGLTLPDMCCTGDQWWPLHCLTCVVQATSDGPYIARHSALRVGVPDVVPAHNVNRMCGSGFQSIINASQVQTFPSEANLQHCRT